MKIVVIGGTGLIGSKTVVILRQRGHDVAAASPQSGVNTITGEGLKEALAGAQVVIDLANSPSFEDKAVLDFFKTSEGNLLPAEAAAGVGHHVALSIVAIDRTDNGYFRAKLAQEQLIAASGVPYTIVRSTQFMEFLGGIANSSATGNTVRLPPSCSSPSRRTTSPPTSPRRRSPAHETASSRSPARNARHLPKSSPGTSRRSATRDRW